MSERGYLDSKKAQERLKLREKVTRGQYDKDLRDLMATPAGRRFVYRLCFDTCGLLSGSFTGNSETFYREGRRSIGAFVWAEAQRVAPADSVRSHTEALQAQQEAELHRRDAAASAAKENEDGDTGGSD